MNQPNHMPMKYMSSNRSIWLQVLFKCQLDDVDNDNDNVSEYASECVADTISKQREIEERTS